MEISDLLSLSEIAVTILLGYYITHWITVKDQRTRTVNDYYISQLKDIRKDVDAFFREMLKGNLNCRRISDWYGNQEGRLNSFDEGLRLALPLRKKRLTETIDEIHREITITPFFNDHFNDRKLLFSNVERANVLNLKNKIDKSFNEYIIQINNSRPKSTLETLWQNFVLENDFHKNVRNKKYPYFSTLWNRILKLLPYLFVAILLSYLAKIAWSSYQTHDIKVEKEKLYRDSLMLEMNIHIKEQSQTLNSFLMKYKPVQVDCSRYYKNTIFNGINKVDTETVINPN